MGYKKNISWNSFYHIKSNSKKNPVYLLVCRSPVSSAFIFSNNDFNSFAFDADVGVFSVGFVAGQYQHQYEAVV